MNAKQLIGIVLVLSSFAASAAEIPWNGGDGKWSDPKSWKYGAVPTAADTAIFKDGFGGTVELDGEETVGGILIYGSSNTEPTDPADTVRFVGTGTLNVTGSLQIYAGRKLQIDGGTMKIKNQLAFNNASGFVATLEMNGGVLEYGSFYSKSASHRIDQRAGTLVCQASMTPFADSSEDGVLHIDGDLYITNSVTSQLRFKCMRPTLAGSGSVYASGILIVKPTGTDPNLTFDIAKICLGGHSDGFCFIDSGNDTIRFPRHTTFGAFADWGVPNNELRCSLNFERGLDVDTADCFGGAVAHSIQLKSVNVYPGMPLRASGGGSAEINFRNVPNNVERLSELTVGAGTTLTLSPVAVKADRLTMGAGSTLNISADNAVEVFEEDADPTAVVTVTIPAKVASGTWTVYRSSKIDSAVARNMRIVGDNPNNLKLIAVGGCVVLTDDVLSVQESGTVRWTGAEDGYTGNAANWVGGTLPASGSPVYLTSNRHTCMTNNLWAAQKKSFNVVRIRVDAPPAGGASARPYLLTGDQIYLNGSVVAGDNAPVYNANGYPLYLDVDVSRPSGNAAFSAIQKGDAFTVFGRALTLLGEFRPIGDIRISGALSCASVWLTDTVGASRPNTLTILNGGVATVAGQSAETSQTKGVFRVLAGGRLEVQGGAWQWTEPVTNVVDGTLVLGAKPDGAAELYFGGTGEIVLTNDALGVWAQDLTFVGANTLKLAGDRAFDALSVADGATVTLDANGKVLTLNEPMPVGVGFVAGTTVVLGETLAASAAKGWTTIAWIAEGGSVPTVAGEYRTRVVNGALQAKASSGLILLFR